MPAPDVDRIDPVDRAHLTGRSRPTPPIARYSASPAVAGLVSRYWVPVWSLPSPQTQTTLQHPVCLLVVTPAYARLYGVARGASSVTLEGDGWAVGVLLRPAAGSLLVDGSVAPLVDGDRPIDGLPGLDGPALVAGVRDAMTDDPGAEASHRTAIAAYEGALAGLLPLDEEGVAVNRVVDLVATLPVDARVVDLAEACGLTERTLQRLVTRRVGITPKWLLQRRRLHDAVERLKAGETSLAAMAAELGYTDQAHFTHDFRTVTGLTPGRYLADQPAGS
ncbi:helix-turn-helix domain-containing protein [uncultured Nocardioides sp.]|uniref:helix-turn-helix domain-containing protein n=1 Tax=uncultured Nocardioides sp. TaxID=198441 RepID=UPI002617F80C|nr:helix-turn-helix domain-containing protein [uncultured Nocardioides sp.]